MADSTAVTRSSTLPESKVDPTQVLKASNALLAYIKKTAKEEVAKSGKRNLLAAAADDDDQANGGEGDEDGSGGGLGAEAPIWLTISTKRHILDSHRLQPCKVVVPHPLTTADEDTTICLITADPQRAYKNLIAADAFPAALRKCITRVVDITHLGKKFKSYEAQRKLFAEHDIFLGDERIINRLPKLLGRTFYKTTVKRPIPVVLNKRRPRGADGKAAKPPAPKKSKKNGSGSGLTEDQALAVEQATENARSPEQIAGEIEKAIGAAVVHLGPSASTSVKVALAGWPADRVAANIEAVCREVVGKHVPQKWSNVRSIFVKGQRTMALPVWQTDELWVQGDKDVLKAGSEELQQYEARQTARREKSNVGKKRKALTDAAAETADKPAAAKKAAAAKAGGDSARPAKKAKKLPESNDGGLDKQIVAHKEKLKKQKSAAKKAMEI